MARKLLLAVALGALLMQWASHSQAGDHAKTAIRGDADVLGLVTSVHQHEIASADLARAKHVTGDTLAYAETLHQDHSTALEKTRQLAREIGVMPSTDGVVAKKREQFKQHEAHLQAVAQPEFSQEYVDAMVEGHQQVLSLIDDQLMPAAKSPEVKDLLKTTRESVNRHLAKGREVAEKQDVASR